MEFHYSPVYVESLQFHYKVLSRFEMIASKVVQTMTLDGVNLDASPEQSMTSSSSTITRPSRAGATGVNLWRYSAKTAESKLPAWQMIRMKRN